MKEFMLAGGGGQENFALPVEFDHRSRTTVRVFDCAERQTLRWLGGRAVSYTHLTLPTIYSV